MHVPRLVGHHHTALALHEQPRWSARITVTALAVGGILIVASRSDCGEPAHCAGPLLRRRDGCLRIAFSVRYSARDGLSPDAVGADARRSRLGPPVAEISTDLAQAWRERAFQGALAGLARDFE